MAEISAEEKERRFVHEVYDAIAPHFSVTRYKAWPRVERYLSEIPKFSIIGDIGCGNGKNLIAAPHCYGIGCDRSGALVAIANEKGFEAAVADNLALPFRTSCYDHLISVAVIHHFSTPERRLLAVEELLRIVKPGGTIFICVWALEQQSRKYDEQDVLVSWELQDRYSGQKQPKTQKKKGRDQPVDAAETAEEPVVEQRAPQVFQRYYHMFVEGELPALVKQATNCELVEQGYERDNWWVVIRKQ